MAEKREREFGKHYLVEFTGCDPGKMKFVDDVREALLESARVSGATILGSHFHQFEPHGVTGMVFIAESHFSIHTWPEDGYAAFDILTCGVMDPERAIGSLSKSLEAGKVEIRVFSRGFDA